MNECNEVGRNEKCTCSYTTCSRKGKCCDCVEYHLVNNELPGCVFAKISEKAEHSYDRTFEHFAKLILKK